MRYSTIESTGMAYLASYLGLAGTSTCINGHCCYFTLAQIQIGRKDGEGEGEGILYYLTWLRMTLALGALAIRS